MSQTVKQPDETTDELSEPQRRALAMGAVVHRRSNWEPFVPLMRVAYPVDVRELMGRCDPDEFDDRSLPDE